LQQRPTLSLARDLLHENRKTLPGGLACPTMSFTNPVYMAGSITVLLISSVGNSGQTDEDPVLMEFTLTWQWLTEKQTRTLMVLVTGSLSTLQEVKVSQECMCRA
jgi:hypothetical protein